MSKKYGVSYEEGKVVVKVDLDGDGKPLLKVELDVTEIPGEAIEAWHAAQGEKEADEG